MTFKIFQFLSSNLLLATFSKSFGAQFISHKSVCSVMLTLSPFIFILQESRIICKDKMEQTFHVHITAQTEISIRGRHQEQNTS